MNRQVNIRIANLAAAHTQVDVRFLLRQDLVQQVHRQGFSF